LKAQHNSNGTKAGKASKGLIYIQQLYRIEKQIQHLDTAARYQKRQQQAVPLLNEIRTWLDASLPQVPPISLTGKALSYLDNQWNKLVCYCEDGRLDIDNNATERAIRPFVIGRNYPQFVVMEDFQRRSPKNHYFCWPTSHLPH
jgi:hypothetical protein